MTVHGTQSTYVNHRCRCDPCRASNTAVVAERRAKRAAERVVVDGRLTHPTAEHGKGATYQNYACRCAPCTAAHLTDKNRKAHA